MSNDRRDHKKKSEKIGFFRNFFGIFRIFSDFFGPTGQLLDNFGQLLDNFIGTFQYKNDSNKIFMDYIR